MHLKGSGVYKNHRIHVAQLLSGVWVASVVKLGRSGVQPGSPPVKQIRGEYASHDEAVSAAKQRLDQEDISPESPPQ